MPAQLVVPDVQVTVQVPADAAPPTCQAPTVHVQAGEAATTVAVTLFSAAFGP